ncbi:MAG TPA: arsenic transporter [Acidobacteriaceae bacterium]|nr:arsenic transporter [Acidobacteriaceae bacterium]
MHVSTLMIWAIALLSILFMLVRPKGITEAWWVGAGALLLVLFRLVSVRSAVSALAKGVDVYLFLSGMMVLSELAREEGVFGWVASIAAREARGSARRLFLLVYVVGTLVTTLLSNDATAVVLTPAVLAVVRRAGVKPKPYLLICAMIANAASFVLPISNPANLVIFATHMPPLGSWLRTFFLPSLGSILVTLVLLFWISRRDLQCQPAPGSDIPELSPGGRVALAGLLLSCGVLLGASALGMALGGPTAVAALAVMLLVAYKDRGAPLRVVREVSWSILPLVGGLFVIVEAVAPTGLLRAAVDGLGRLSRLPEVPADLCAGFSVGLLSNAINNLPVGLISGSALQAASQIVPDGLRRAVLIGVDLGPNLSVTGSLATILWLIALRREGVEIGSLEFLKAGILIMPVALIVSLLLLSA